MIFSWRRKLIYQLTSLIALAGLIIECSNANPNLGLFGNYGSLNYAEFGTGTDGPLALGVGAYSTATLLPGGQKKIAASARIIGLSADGLTFTLAPTPNMVKNPAAFPLTDDLDVGDEVGWIVIAANSSGGPDNACGGNLYRGNFYGHFAHVTAVGTTSGFVSSVTLDQAIGSQSQISDIVAKNNLKNPLLSSSFCLLQLVRVPNFTSLTISSMGAATSLSALPLDYVGSGLNSASSVQAFAQDSSNGLLIAGQFAGYNSSGTANLVRLNADGTQDFTFNPMGTGFDGPVYAIAIDPSSTDGYQNEIVVAGNFTSYNYAGTTTAAPNGIIRLNTNGSPDLSFSVPYAYGPSVNSISIDTSGNVILGGSFTVGPHSYLVRLLPSGAVDTNFLSAMAGPNNAVYATYALPGQTLIGGSFTTVDGTTVGHIARLDGDGSLDTTLSQGTGFNNTVRTITADSSNNYFVGGSFSTYNGATANGIIKIASSGLADSGFVSGMSGGLSTGGVVYSLLLQSSTELIIGGSFTTYAGSNAINIARVGAVSGAFDTSFNSGGTGASGIVTAVAVDPNNANQVYIGGTFTSYDGAAWPYLLRLNVNGNADPNFNYVGTGTGGVLTFKVNGPLILTSTSAQVTLGATGMGLPGGQGIGGNTAYGFGTTGPWANDDGGASAVTAAGGSGGGNQGAGGVGGGAAGSAGVALNYCGGQCMADSKGFMGGGGGGGINATALGGAGGGLTMIYARSIMLSGAYPIIIASVGGAPTPSLGGGGGAGGTALVETKDISGLSGLSILADGSAGANGTYAGGGGGGGAAKLKTCTIESVGPAVSAAGGTSSASPGSAGSTAYITGDPMMCNLP